MKTEKSYIVEAVADRIMPLIEEGAKVLGEPVFRISAADMLVRQKWVPQAHGLMPEDLMYEVARLTILAWPSPQPHFVIQQIHHEVKPAAAIWEALNSNEVLDRVKADSRCVMIDTRMEVQQFQKRLLDCIAERKDQVKNSRVGDVTSA